MIDTMEYIKRAHLGDKEARDLLVTENMGLVWSIVRRFSNRGYELEDLFQIGSIGLMKAIDKFDLEMDVKFSTYAVPMITGEIRRFLRDDGMIKVSRPLKELAMKAGMARDYPIVVCFDTLLIKLGITLNTLSYELTTKNYFISLISLVIAPAICEELLFRGIIFSGLKSYGKSFYFILQLQF